MLCFTGNWYEDRLATPRKQLSEDEEKEVDHTIRHDKLVRGKEPDTFRTQTVDFAKSPSEPYTAADTMRTAQTTKIEMEAQLSEVCCLVQQVGRFCTSKPVQHVEYKPRVHTQVLRPQQKPMMINCENLKQAMQADRVLPGPSTGFGSVLPRHRETHENLYTTSNKVRLYRHT